MTLIALTRQSVGLERKAGMILRSLGQDVHWLTDEDDLIDWENSFVIAQAEGVRNLKWGSHTRQIESVPTIHLPFFAQYPADGFCIKSREDGREDSFEAAIVNATIICYVRMGHTVPDKLLKRERELVLIARKQREGRKLIRRQLRFTNAFLAD